MHAQDPLDLIIVGGGIGGVISLYYAKKAGLKVLLIEKQPGVGGLWAQLPAWQDIQINPVDWALGDIPISGPLQASIARHIQAWVDKFDLASSMLLDTAVTTAKESPEGWTVTTAHQRYFSRFLIAATGGHNRAFTPRTERINASIQEYHSSALDDPQVLTGKDVLVVGGGASAYDLLDLCFEHQARRVVWLYRSLKWMLPTRKPKHIAGDIRGLAKQQMSGVSIAQMNRDINLDLQGRYEKFGLQDILPAGEFDITRDQLIPGRRAMIENFSKIERHQGEIAQIADRTVQISSGERIDVDLILWGTGYAMDLRYFESPPWRRSPGLTNWRRVVAACFDHWTRPSCFSWLWDSRPRVPRPGPMPTPPEPSCRISRARRSLMRCPCREKSTTSSWPNSWPRVTPKLPSSYLVRRLQRHGLDPSRRRADAYPLSAWRAIASSLRAGRFRITQHALGIFIQASHGCRLGQRQPHAKRQFLPRMPRCGAGNNQAFGVCHHHATFRRHFVGLGNTPAFGIAAQHVPALTAQVQVGRAFFGTAQVAQKIRAMHLDLVHDGIHISCHRGVADGKHIGPRDTPARRAAFGGGRQLRPQAQTPPGDAAGTQHLAGHTFNQCFMGRQRRAVAHQGGGQVRQAGIGDTQGFVTAGPETRCSMPQASSSISTRSWLGQPAER